MRRQFVLLSVIACMAGCLSACVKAAMGPDLSSRPSPFVTEGVVELRDAPGTTVVTINTTPQGDTGQVRYASIGEQPYRASLTYRAFTPIISETNATQNDYWLVGVNLTMTPDRSFYAILRYPHGRPLQPHSVRNDFEFRILDCIDGGKAQPAAEDAAASESLPATQIPEWARDIRPGVQPDVPADLLGHQDNDAACVFDRIETIVAFANKALQQDDADRQAARSKPDEPYAARWTKLTVTAQ